MFDIFFTFILCFIFSTRNIIWRIIDEIIFDCFLILNLRSHLSNRKSRHTLTDWINSNQIESNKVKTTQYIQTIKINRLTLHHDRTKRRYHQVWLCRDFRWYWEGDTTKISLPIFTSLIFPLLIFCIFDLLTNCWTFCIPSASAFLILMTHPRIERCVIISTLQASVRKFLLRTRMSTYKNLSHEVLFLAWRHFCI